MQYDLIKSGVIWPTNLISDTGLFCEVPKLMIGPLTVSGLPWEKRRGRKSLSWSSDPDGIRFARRLCETPQIQCWSSNHWRYQVLFGNDPPDPPRNHPKNQHKTTPKLQVSLKINQLEGFEPWDPSHEKERAKICRKLKSRASGTVWASSYSQIIVLKSRIRIFARGGSFRLHPPN